MRLLGHAFLPTAFFGQPLLESNLTVIHRHAHVRASMVAQLVKNPPAMQETQVPSLGWEDPLEEGMATHSGILAWRIPRMEELGGLQSMGVAKRRTRLRGSAQHSMHVYMYPLTVCLSLLLLNCKVHLDGNNPRAQSRRR